MSRIDTTLPVRQQERAVQSAEAATNRGAAVRAWMPPVILAVLCASLFFYGLNSGELYRTESLRAIIAAEFLRSGNWIVPTLYGEPIFTKPPGMYAAIALVSWPFGEVSEWTARLPSALAATLTVFLVYWHFARQLGRGGGLVAALILPASAMWLDKATAAEIDMMQVAWITASLLFFLRALEAAEARTPDAESMVLSYRVSAGGEVVAQSEKWGHFPMTHSTQSVPISRRPTRRAETFWWSAALLAVAGGVLTKWTAPAFFYGTVVPLLWWRGRLRLLFGWHHVLGVALCAGVCLAWIGTAIGLAGWHPFYDTVSREALMRLLPTHHHRPYPWGETLTHPWKILVTNLPWSLAAVLTLRPGFAQLWDERGKRLLQALHCWTWPNVFFWSIIPEHGIRHSFPLFPGIAGLAAMVWIAWLRGELGPWRLVRPATVLVAMMVCWLGVKVVFVQVVIPPRAQHRQARAKGELVASLVGPRQTLYLFKLKDEGIMFYYGRPVRRLSDPSQLPSQSEPLYCILDETEWQIWRSRPGVEVIRHMSDEQGAPIALVKLVGRNAPWSHP